METYRQFADRERRRLVAENSGLTLAECKRVFPHNWWVHDWRETLHQAAERGEVLPARIWDELYREHRDYARILRHDHARAMPADYIIPEFREKAGRANG